MAHYISEDCIKYIEEKYGLNINNDINIISKGYNPNICLARLWKSDPEYIPNAGGYTNFQCSYPRVGSTFCECHSKKNLEGNLPFGRIDENIPDEPYITDIEGNKERYYWMHQSQDKRIIKYVEDACLEGQQKHRKGRGRPAFDKIPYDKIDWEDYCKEGNLIKLSTKSLKEYLEKNDLNVYGKKVDLIQRIEDNIINDD
mgnify:CR=1 FL=1|jgi:hypothetical protein